MFEDALTLIAKWVYRLTKIVLRYRVYLAVRRGLENQIHPILRLGSCHSHSIPPPFRWMKFITLLRAEPRDTACTTMCRGWRSSMEFRDRRDAAPPASDPDPSCVGTDRTTRAIPHTRPPRRPDHRPILPAHCPRSAELLPRLSRGGPQVHSRPLSRRRSAATGPEIFCPRSRSSRHSVRP